MSRIDELMPSKEIIPKREGSHGTHDTASPANKENLRALPAGQRIFCRHAARPMSFTFRKIAAEAVYVCQIQWEKYGIPRFVVIFGKCGAQGVIVRGKEVMPEDIFPECTPERGILQPGRSRTTGGWFRQDRPLLERLIFRSRYYPAEQVVAQLMSLFGEVESFWRSGTLGWHIHLSPVHPLAVHNIFPESLE